MKSLFLIRSIFRRTFSHGRCRKATRLLLRLGIAPIHSRERPSFTEGLDIGAPAGTPILASADGVVTVANSTDSWGYGYGYHVKIKHNETCETLYAHCSNIAVTYGQEVKKGQVIGYVGTTGNSTGKHLHFEVYKDGERTNPLGYFEL